MRSLLGLPDLDLQERTGGSVVVRNKVALLELQQNTFIFIFSNQKRQNYEVFIQIIKFF